MIKESIVKFSAVLGCFLIFGLLTNCTERNQNKTYRLFISVCSSGTEFELDGQALCFSYGLTNKQGQAIISQTDLDKLYNELDSFMENPEDEIFIVPWINDGTTLQMFIGHSDGVKKVLISNYLELRFNRIAIILNRYVPEEITHECFVPFDYTDSTLVANQLHEQKTSIENPLWPIPKHFLKEALQDHCFLYESSYKRVYEVWSKLDW